MVIVIGVSKHVFPLSIQYLPTSKEYLSMTSGLTKLCRLAIKRLNQTFCHSEGEMTGMDLRLAVVFLVALYLSKATGML